MLPVLVLSCASASNYYVHIDSRYHLEMARVGVSRGHRSGLGAADREQLGLVSDPGWFDDLSAELHRRKRAVRHVLRRDVRRFGGDVRCGTCSSSELNV